MDEAALKSLSDFVMNNPWKKETEQRDGTTRVVCAYINVPDSVFPRENFDYEAYFDGEVGEDRHRVSRKRVKALSPAIANFRAAAQQMLMEDFKFEEGFNKQAENMPPIAVSCISYGEGTRITAWGKNADKIEAVQRAEAERRAQQAEKERHVAAPLPKPTLDIPMPTQPFWMPPSAPVIQPSIGA